jgi:hypothetical protein
VTASSPEAADTATSGCDGFEGVMTKKPQPLNASGAGLLSTGRARESTVRTS